MAKPRDVKPEVKPEPPATGAIHVARFVHSVVLPHATFHRPMQCTEVHASEGFAFEATPIGLTIVHESACITVPWANVRSLDHVVPKEPKA